jgi:hypothetical protein
MSQRNKLVSRTLIEEVSKRVTVALVDELVSADFQRQAA